MSITARTATSVSPVVPSQQAHAALRTLGLDAVRITGGLCQRLQEINRTVSLPDGLRQLEKAGNLANFRISAGAIRGEVRGPVFADSDVYKWLEAAAWEYGRDPHPDLLRDQLKVTALIAAAQEPDGYINTIIQMRGDRYRNLSRDHELYCGGHLFQAAVAQARSTGRQELLRVACRFADHLATTFGPDRRQDVDGHPVVEMGLVELYRVTGTSAYLELARYFVDARGRGLTARYGGGDAAYLSDRVPLREATTVEGHAVRAVYLRAGAADVALEVGDEGLLAALAVQYAHMRDTKQYVTGALGSRWEGEAFGDPYELPADRAYGETCAAIGAMQWAWRMLLATGESAYADQMERLFFNGVVPGVSLRGGEYFYVNTLHLRQDAEGTYHNRSAASGRHEWFNCACCPPNLMRTFAQLAGYLATTTGDGVQLHQYAPASIVVPTEAGILAVRVETDYPWRGSVRIVVEQAPEGELALALRVPAWAEGATLDGAPAAAGGYASLSRAFRAGDEVRLELPLVPRLVRAHERVDAVRGCAAIERGPLVYAVEEHDQAPGVAVDDLRIAPPVPFSVEQDTELLGGVTVLRFPARRAGSQDLMSATAIPYYAWANRGVGPMRVWLPLAQGG